MSALSVTASVVAGMTRPAVPSRRPASAVASLRLPIDSASPTITRLPSAWPASSPVWNRCSNAAGHGPSSVASAIRLLRRSPGAGTPRSRRSRPDDPPSSATVTIAVIEAAYSRAARNVTASPCPPPNATTFALASRAPSDGTFDVPVVHRGAAALAVQALRELLRDHDAAVTPAGAPERDGEVRLALALVAGKQQSEQPVELVEELARPALREHVVAHRRVASRERAQLIDPVRVGKEAAVEHEVDVEREPVLVPERHDVHLERRFRGVLREQLAQAVA